MRTNVKSKEYFEKFFELQLDDLHYYENSLKEGEVKEDRVMAIKSTIFLNSLHTVIAKYSYGENPKDLVNEFLTVITRLEQGWDDEGATPEDDIHFDNYVVMLWMLSLGILLDISNEDFNRIVTVLDKSNRKDFLFDYLILFKTKNRLVTKKLTYEVYKPLFDICNSTEKSGVTEKLKIFLDKKWYKGMKRAYWYENHNSKADTFFGYWSFESGAIAKIFDLDDTSIKDSNFYPYDLVHWKNEKQ